MSDVLDTIRGVGWIAQVHLIAEDRWVSWTQYTTEHRTHDEARALARTHVEQLLRNKPNLFDRGRVVRADWIVEEVLAPPATEGDSDAD